MNTREQNEIDELPDKYRPLGAWGYFGYSLLFGLGLIGLICAIVFAFNNDNIARRNYARGCLISSIIVTVITVIIVVACWGLIVALIAQMPPQ